MMVPCASPWLLTTCCYRPVSVNHTTARLGRLLLTCHDELQVEGVLAGPVAGDAGVDAGVAAGHGLDDQRVDAVFPHQHLMGRVGADGLSVQLPDEVRGRQAVHLQVRKSR